MTVTTTATPRIPSSHFRKVCKEKSVPSGGSRCRAGPACAAAPPPSLPLTHLHGAAGLPERRGAERRSGAAQRGGAGRGRAWPGRGRCPGRRSRAVAPRCDPAAALGDCPCERRRAGAGPSQEASSAGHRGFVRGLGFPAGSAASRVGV